MKISRIITATAFLVLALNARSLSRSLVSTAHADDNGPADCAIGQSDLDQISAAEAQGLTAELAARKQVLGRVIACAKTDAAALQRSLDGVTVASDEAPLKAQLSDRLSDALNFYDIELAKVNGSGIAGTKAVAKEVLAWRQANYDPLAAQVGNFTLWEKNQDLFPIATSRFNQVKNVVSFIEQAGPQPALDDEITSAQASLRNANAENQSARTALLESLPSDQTLTIITSSLQSLSDTYKEFSDIIAATQKLLPTSGS